MIPSNTVASQKKTSKIEKKEREEEGKKKTNLQSTGDGQSRRATFNNVTIINSKQPGKEDDQYAKKLQT